MKMTTTDKIRTQDSSHWPAEVAVNRENLISLRSVARGLTLIPNEGRASAHSGQHQSRFRGRGMDYLESRHYQAGDDVRNMDWRVTARTNQAHIKLYVEEREQPIVILVDLSAGMSLASQGAFKSVIAARIAAILGWVAVGQSDRIGGLVYRGMNEHNEIKPQAGRRGILQLIDSLVQLGKPHTDFNNEQAGLPDLILKKVTRMAGHGSQVIVISDFFYPSFNSHEYLEKLKQHNNLLAIQIVDPLELASPPVGEYGVSDGISSWSMNLDSHYQQQRLDEELNVRQKMIQKEFLDLNIPLLQVQTHDDVNAVLHHVLKHKTRNYPGGRLIQAEVVA